MDNDNERTITAAEMAKYINRSKQTVAKIKGLPPGILIGTGSDRNKHYPYQQAIRVLDAWREKNDALFLSRSQFRKNKIVYYVFKGFHLELLKFVKSGLHARFNGYDENELKKGHL